MKMGTLQYEMNDTHMHMKIEQAPFNTYDNRSVRHAYPSDLDQMQSPTASVIHAFISDSILSFKSIVRGRMTGQFFQKFGRFLKQC